MTPRNFRPYRALRIVLALILSLPRYWVLLAREAIGRPAGAAAWRRAHEAAAEQIRLLALALHGGLIKAAQIGGARADVFPKPFIDKLSQFHDDVPPRPLEALLPLIESELGASIDSLFSSIEPISLGAASLAQVHRARLRDHDTDVVIKIQYPEARKIIPLDMLMVRRVAWLIQRMQSSLDLSSIANEISRFVEMELDFRREAASTKRLAMTLSGRDDVRLPRIIDRYSRDRIIVMEYLDGIPTTRVPAIRGAGHRLSNIARTIGDLYGSMIFEHGFFHGDPHPGNLLVLPDGKIGLLDFGLCKELPPHFAGQVAQMLVSALIGDGDAAIAAAGELGFDVEHTRPEHLRSLVLRIVGDADEDDDLVAILGASRIKRIPGDFALVLRTMLLLNGLSHRLAPGRRLVQAELIEKLAAGARGDFLETESSLSA